MSQQQTTDPYLPPCQVACPIHQDVRGYLFAIATGNFDRALAIVKETNPLPFICGTICARHCEDECRRADVDEAVFIRALKRAAAEKGSARVSPVSIPKDKGKVAVIGAGPGGLTAAYDLARKGCAVTVFERDQMAGGAVRQFIPLYRLPDEAIDQDLEDIAGQGVEFRYGMELGKNLTLDQLEQEGYEATLVALGLPLSHSLNIPGAEGDGVLHALSFLKQVKREDFKFEGSPTVVVIGGGNVAMDVARSAVRCGAGKVKVVCLESAVEMPAFPWEIEEAKEEGVEFYCSWGPDKIKREEGRITGLEMVQCTCVFDAEQRFAPQYNRECLEFVSGDIIVFSIGQKGDPEPLRGEIELDERGRVIFNAETMATNRRGVFICGEMALGPGTAVQAMADGRKAALSLLAYLENGAFDSASLEVAPALDKLESGICEKVKRIDRSILPMIEPVERIKHYRQVEQGFDVPGAVYEARRCLACAAGAERVEELCANCLTCLRICPYDVPVIDEEGQVNVRNEMCQACGLCVGICPAYAIKFRSSYIDDAVAAIEPAVKDLLARRNGKPLILALTCAYGAFALPEFLDFKADNVAVVRFPCIAKIDSLHLLKAMELGVDGVVMVGCKDETRFQCQYQDSAFWAGRHADRARKVLRDLGLEEERLMLVELSQEEVSDFGKVLEDAAGKLAALGSSPLG